MREIITTEIAVTARYAFESRPKIRLTTGNPRLSEPSFNLLAERVVARFEIDDDGRVSQRPTSIYVEGRRNDDDALTKIDTAREANFGFIMEHADAAWLAEAAREALTGKDTA